MIRVAIALSLLLVGCTVDPAASPHRCSSNDECPTGRCHRPGPDGLGLCVGGGDADAGCDPSSPMSCGECNVVCADPTPACQESGGAYTCVAECAPRTNCGGTCVDTSMDARHCGECGAPCDPDEICSGSRCLCGGVECGDFEACCGGTCVDPSMDARHCGGCGASCDPDETCSGSRCLCGGVECGPTETCCAGTCVDTSEDMAHCGGCEDACPSMTVCRGGECNCGGVDDCRGRCVAGACA